MVNNIQTNDDLKQHMDAMFSFASKVSYRECHLLSVIQASKSLIGLSLDNPPRNVLKWIEKYIQQFQLDHKIPEYLNDEDKPEVLSILSLEKLIANEEIEKSRKYLMHLIPIADSSYIMELLLEISFKYSISAILFCWYACKAIQFMEDREEILLLSLDCLYANPKEKDGEEDAREQILLSCHSYQIRETNLIRSKKILHALDEKIETFKAGKNDHDIIPSKLLACISKNGERGLVNYLQNLSVDEISHEHIMDMDAMRSVLRYASDDVFDFKMGKMKTIC